MSRDVPLVGGTFKIQKFQPPLQTRPGLQDINTVQTAAQTEHHLWRPDLEDNVWTYTLLFKLTTRTGLPGAICVMNIHLTKKVHTGQVILSCTILIRTSAVCVLGKIPIDGTAQRTNWPNETRTQAAQSSVCRPFIVTILNKVAHTACLSLDRRSLYRSRCREGREEQNSKHARDCGNQSYLCASLYEVYIRNININAVQNMQTCVTLFLLQDSFHSHRFSLECLALLECMQY